MPGHTILLAEAAALRPTEAVFEDKLSSFESELRLLGFWSRPLVVEARSQLVLDGNHRLAAARRLGLRAVPVVKVDFADPGVTLSAWRPAEQFTGDDLGAAAAQGQLLPPHSLRLRLDRVLPHCRVALSTLATHAAVGLVVEATWALPRRADILAVGYHALGRRIGISTLAARRIDSESAETLAPHPRLRQMLQADPSMAALLPGAPARFSLAHGERVPFELRGSGLILLSADLLDDPAALAIAARWALEAVHVRASGAVGERKLAGLLLHAAGLLRQAAPVSRELLLDGLPPPVAAELSGGDTTYPSAALIAWQAGLIGVAPPVGAAAPPGAGEGDELAGPVEAILVAGGDSRLELDPATGQNCYGVPPRPRPEAIHFSSSTASAVSDDGFVLCDLLRRDLLRALSLDGADPRELLRRTADAVGRELCLMLGLGEEEVDVAITASGTDAELHTVMLARAAGAGRTLTNILISSDESGRGVLLAGAGCYFDNRSATWVPVRKGDAAWPEAGIRVVDVPIRDSNGRPRALADVDADVVAAGRAALAEGGQVLVHMLIASKTGLSAPSPAAIDAVVAMAPQRVVVVVDACQMRSAPGALGALVRAGWMLQVSGSKFLTGPPFSGALVIPKAMRVHVEPVGAALASAPGVGHADVWSKWWAERLPRATAGRASFGPLFRWLPALFEARLLDSLPEDFRRAAFRRFRDAVAKRLAASVYVRPIDVGEAPDTDDFARLSIQSFQVLGRRQDGSLAALDEAACRDIFRWLNRDVRDDLPGLSRAQSGLAAQACHIGQPVALGGIAVLRMVLGARFFGIVGFAGLGAVEAALESEIADALRAIAKLELLASEWWRLARRKESLDGA